MFASLPNILFGSKQFGSDIGLTNGHGCKNPSPTEENPLKTQAQSLRKETDIKGTTREGKGRVTKQS